MGGRNFKKAREIWLGSSTSASGLESKVEGGVVTIELWLSLLAGTRERTSQKSFLGCKTLGATGRLSKRGGRGGKVITLDL